MQKLTRDDLYPLEAYSEVRKDFRARVMQHKKNRKVQIGPNATLYFEDRLVMQYQIQEVLRSERIFEAAGIEEELEAYNPLIPDGSNWKATFMIEFVDAEERRVQLQKLLGIEKKVWVKVSNDEHVYPIANEDLTRETEDKTSAVHFLRFELSPEMIRDIKQGAAVSMGIDHPEYEHKIDAIPDSVRDSLAEDLEQ